MPLPNFIIFGAIKSGTGALYQYLGHHPEIFMSSEKEPRFFTNKKIWTDEGSDENIRKYCEERLNEYLQYFKGVRNEKAIGEASSNYINSASAALRIKETIPNVKLIASLRNPVDRAYAHFRMMSKSQKNVNFNAMSSGKAQGWATTSLYYKQLDRYYKVFHSNQIKILIFEKWTHDVPGALKDIYNFLEIDKNYKISPKTEYTAGEVTWPGLRRGSLLKRIKPYIPAQILMNVNKIKKKMGSNWPPLPNELRKEMQKWYYDDVLKLQSLINKDLSIWLKR